MKSTATRSVLTSGNAFLSVTDLYNFTKKFNEDATQANYTTETPINVFHLESGVVERVLEDLFTKRWNLLSGAFEYFFHDSNGKFLF